MEESIKIFPVNSSVSNAKRPKFSALDLTKIKNEFIYAICDWRSSLEICLSKSI